MYIPYDTLQMCCTVQHNVDWARYDYCSEQEAVRRHRLNRKSKSISN